MSLRTSPGEHPIIVALKPILLDLSSKDPRSRTHGISQLQALIEEEGDIRFHRSHQLNAQSKLLSDYIFNSLHQLFTVADSRLGGVLAVEALYPVEYCDVTIRTERLSELLLGATIDSSVVSEEAARVWGAIIAHGSGVASDILQEQLRRCLGLIASDKSDRRHVGCLLLYRIMERAPSAAIPSLEPILGSIHNAISDNLDKTRICASLTLRSALSLTCKTDNRNRSAWVSDLLDTALKCFYTKSSSTQHSGWLILNAVLDVCSSTAAVAGGLEISRERMQQAWRQVLAALQRLPSNPDHRKELHTCIPLMARYDKATFVETLLGEVIQAAVAVFRSINSTVGEKDQMFVMIGKLGLAMPEMVPVYLDRMVRNIKDNLISTKKPKKDRCGEAVTCLSLLAQADPLAVRPYVGPLLDALFSTTLTSEFAQNVALLCKCFPELQSSCLDRVLILTKQQFQSLAGRRAALINPDPGHTKLVVDTFESLKLLDFRGYSTLNFLSLEVAHRFWDPHPAVRQAAVELCIHLLLTGCEAPGSPCRLDDSGVMIHQGAGHIGLILRLQKLLLAVAVADPESDIRVSTLQMLTEKFDHTLCMEGCVRSIFPALNDKHLNRSEAVRLLGRLSKRNPAPVFPILRRVLVQCITEVEYVDGKSAHVNSAGVADERKLEQATLLLGSVVESAPELAQPYRAPLLAATVRRLQDTTTSVRVMTALLSCVGKLVLNITEDDMHLVEDVKPLIVSHIINGGPTAKRQEAIRALSCIVRASRDVSLYDQFPHLLPTLLSMLHGGFKEVWAVRRDALSLIGVLGAVDPVRVKSILRSVRDESASADSTATSLRPLLEGLPHTVVGAIIDVMELPTSNDEIISNAVQALVKVFLCGSIKMADAVGYIPRIIPIIRQHIQKHPRLRELFFRELASLVSFFKHFVRTHLDDLFATCKDHLRGHDPAVLRQVIVLLEELRYCLNEEFKPYLPALLPLLVRAMQEDTSPDKQCVHLVLSCFRMLGKFLEGHLHVVLPAVVAIAESPESGERCREQAIYSITEFAKHLSTMLDHAARCVHCIIRLLDENFPMSGSNSSSKSQQGNGQSRVHSIHVGCLQAVGSIAQNLADGFAKFLPLIKPALASRFGEGSREYRQAMETICGAVLSAKRHTYPASSRQLARVGRGEAVPSATPASPIKRPNQNERQRFAAVESVLVATNRSSEEEWKQWLSQFAIELLKASSSQALQACIPLSQVYEPFAQHLFHPAFASCYSEMVDMKAIVAEKLSLVLRSNRVSSEVIQELLNLAEYVGRVEELSKGSRSRPRQGGGGSLFDIHTLANRSESCNLHAKAVHYLEGQFLDLTKNYSKALVRGKAAPLSPADWEELLSVSNRSIALCYLLGQRETANGILTFIQKHFAGLTGDTTGKFDIVTAEMYEKLQWWSQSLIAFRQRLKHDKDSVVNVRGVMSALDALGDFPALLDEYKRFSKRGSKRAVTSLSPIGARAAWLLQSWDDLSQATALMPLDGYEATTAAFYRAVLAVHSGAPTFRHDIDECRRLLDGQLSALVAESYNRAYRLIVGLQQLSELEEIADAKKDRSLIPGLKELWQKRLLAMSHDPSEWQGILANHSIVVRPDEELGMWIKFVGLCRANGRTFMAEEVLNKLQGGEGIRDSLLSPIKVRNANASVVVASLSHMYETGARDDAVGLLRNYVEGTHSAEGCSPVQLATCRAQLADWLVQADPLYMKDVTKSTEILDQLKRATELDSSSGTLWQQWARAHHEIATALGERDPTVESHVVAAVEGYLNSIRSSHQLQDVLGFLSLWFSHGQRTSVAKMVSKGLSSISVHVWLSVVPQIIARIHTSSRQITEAVHNLLVSIAKSHPQALLYTLNVNNNVHSSGTSITADMANRRDAGQRILARVVDMHGSELVDEARMVCQELNRCAVLWSELWADELLKVHGQWEADGDAKKVWASLEQLLSLLDSTDKTAAEESFEEQFGEQLREAANLVYEASQGRKDIQEAWSVFDGILQSMEAQNKTITSLVMDFVSPKLVERGQNLSLVVPGQYAEGKVYPRIAKFIHDMKVMSSKQKPRQIAIVGSDGHKYKFLLKGHEDLRQDERVMQLLGLVNTVLEAYPETKRRDCTVQLYSVTPLGDNAGLVGWVDHCDTLHAIIRKNRNTHNISVYSEMNVINEMTDDYAKLMVGQQRECFEASQEVTDGMDIARHCWTHAPNAEVWLDRRTTYVRTLACMSMVGHILGLGDRHPLNLMMHASSGRIVHIDFGDCFEVAITRTLFPEKVPFRLTRMLVKAMEICGIDGLYRHNCESVMDVLRSERNSLMAMLDAFVHDPLVSWRLDGTEEQQQQPPTRDGSVDPVTQTGSTTAPHVGTFVASSIAVRMGRLQKTVTVAADPEASTDTQDGSTSTLPGTTAISFGTRTAELDRLMVGSVRSIADIARTVRSVRPNGKGIAAAAMLAGTVMGAAGNKASDNKKAQEVIGRVREKLTGMEFAGAHMWHPEGTSALTVSDQVTRLIHEATSTENISQHYSGWCAYW